LLLVMDLTVSVSAPALVTVSLRSFVRPEFTLSKLREEDPRRIAGTRLSKATPFNETFKPATLGSLLERASVPCCDPVEVGVHRTVIARCPSAGMTRFPPPE